MKWSALGAALRDGAYSVLRHPLLALGLALGGMLGVAYYERQGAAQHEAALLTYFKEQRALDSVTQAKTAATHLVHDKELEGLVSAAQQLNGRLVAGLALSIARRDTTIVHAQLPTTNLADSTRVATLRDSTFAGLVDATIKAPPFPAPLSATLTVTRPAFRPQIGFVKVGFGYVATVKWQGESYQIDAPFFEPEAPSRRRVTPYVGGVLLGSDKWITGGATFNVWGVHVGPGVVQKLEIGQRPQLGLSGIWTF